MMARPAVLKKTGAKTCSAKKKMGVKKTCSAKKYVCHDLPW
jgi:hypothetical protein